MTSQPSGPVFVVGSMRSGSTMLRLILDSHPSIAIPGETGFMGGIRAVKEIPNWQPGKQWYERVGWTEPELDERLRVFYGGIFERHAAREGKPRWGEKTPFHTAHMEEMARIFPSSVFVGIVRHPGAVATSLRQRFHYTFSEALDYWAATNLDLMRAAISLGPRLTLCRYEDVLRAGEPVLRELMDFLGEPWSPDLLQHHRVQRAKGAPRAVEGSTITSEAIDTRRADAWTQSIGRDELSQLEATVDLARFFGYDPVDPESGERLTSEDGERVWMPNGDDLALRRHQWRDRIDFDSRPNTVVVHASAQELAIQLARVEQALARARSRRAVRVADALRRVQHGRSAKDLRDAWALVREPRGTARG